MKRIFASLLASAAFLAFSPSFAMAAASPMPMASSKSMMSSSMKSSSMKASTMKCPAGESMVKGYTKANGTVVKPYCRKS